MTIYVAPKSVMNPKDAMAKAIGTIRRCPRVRRRRSPRRSCSRDRQGRAREHHEHLQDAVQRARRIHAGDHSGTPVPNGKLDAVVHIKGHAVSD